MLLGVMGCVLSLSSEDYITFTTKGGSIVTIYDPEKNISTKSINK